MKKEKEHNKIFQKLFIGMKKQRNKDMLMHNVIWGCVMKKV